METTLPPLLGVTAPRIQVQEGTSHTTISTGTLKRYTKDGRVILFNVQTLYDYEATDDSEMSFHAGDIIAVTATPNNGWWHGQLLNDERRQPVRDVFPSNHVLSDGRLFVTVRYDYEASDIHDMSFKAGDIIAFTVTPEDGWWLGELLNEERRQPVKYFPSNFV
ncbi:hypothetical protein MPER_09373 [Moniliophthora perniciosa FA553]|nr:hypothetical protein MPER_09373 [Moniliophthora perniciosa FA553]